MLTIGDIKSSLRMMEREEKERARIVTVSKKRQTLTKYRDDPVAYAHDVLKITTLWPKQIEILESLRRPPFRTLALSSHNIGKTFVAAVAVSWWYDTRNPCGVITTASSGEHVKGVLWKEVRVQRARAGLGIFGDYLHDSPDHYARGIATDIGESFQGRHDLEMLFIVDEAPGVKSIFWTTIKSMFQPDGSHGWLAIGNPTDTTTQAYLESQELDRNGNSRWFVIHISALEHPNIIAALKGEEAPIPGAVSLAMLDEGLEQNCSEVTPGEQLATDIQWPPGSGRYLRPGPIAEARWLGRWPSQGTYGVWNEALWEAVLRPQEESTLILPEIGCDVARFGDDFTSIVCRRGPVALSHETYNGWSQVQIANRLKQLAYQLAAKCSAEHPQREPVKAQEIAIKVDYGLGTGVIDILADQGYAVHSINAANDAYNSSLYPNRRSELWFYTAERARIGQVSLARLPKNVLHEIRKQAMAPIWKMNAAGQKVVEPKEETKKRMKRSPDDMDAVNLAYFESPELILQKPPDKMSAAERRGLLGLGSPEAYERRPGAEKRGLYGR